MQGVVRLGSGAPLWEGLVAPTANATSLCARALLSLPCLSPFSIAYHAIYDKTDNQAHVSLSQGRQLLNFPRKYLLLAPLFLGARAPAPWLSPQSQSPRSLRPQGPPGLTLSHHPPPQRFPSCSSSQGWGCRLGSMAWIPEFSSSARQDASQD